jgi:hypothetical protein
MGNSADVAREHYLQVTDEHFQRVTAQITAQTVANSTGLEATVGNRHIENVLSSHLEYAVGGNPGVSLT